MMSKILDNLRMLDFYNKNVFNYLQVNVVIDAKNQSYKLCAVPGDVVTLSLKCSKHGKTWLNVAKHGQTW